MSEPEPPRDEWTMICPPGTLATAELMAEVMPENIREIVESPLANDQFILVNDSQLNRYWAEMMAAPVRLREPPRYWMPPVAVNDPLSLIRLGSM